MDGKNTILGIFLLHLFVSNYDGFMKLDELWVLGLKFILICVCIYIYRMDFGLLKY